MISLLAGWPELPNFREYMNAVFGELAKTAGRNDLLSALKTADLSTAHRTSQIDKLKKLAMVKDEPIRLMNSQFLGRLHHGEKLLLFLSTEGCAQAEIDALEKELEAFKVEPHYMDEATFLFLKLNLGDLYKLKKEYASPAAAENIVSISESEGYDGHEIWDLINAHDEISVFSIDQDSLLSDRSPWYIASHCACSLRSWRPKEFPQELASEFRTLLSIGNVSPELIYYALTSLHWRQCYLETYKLIESLFYLPWVRRLKRDHGFEKDGLTIARQLREAVGWRQKEKDSIEALFELAGEDIVKSKNLESVAAFRDFDFEKAEEKTFARRIYKIRNVLVHHEDFEDTAPIKFSNDDWPVIVDYLVRIAQRLYRNFYQDSDFSTYYKIR